MKEKTNACRNLIGRDHLGDLGVEGKITLK
jgi:hypothetical protein